jgi:hypothetical protein
MVNALETNHIYVQEDPSKMSIDNIAGPSHSGKDDSRALGAYLLLFFILSAVCPLTS